MFEMNHKCHKCSMVMQRLESGDYDGTDWFCDGGEWLCLICRNNRVGGRLLARASAVVNKFTLMEYRDPWSKGMSQDEIDASEALQKRMIQHIQTSLRWE